MKYIFINNIYIRLITGGLDRQTESFYDTEIFIKIRANYLTLIVRHHICDVFYI